MITETDKVPLLDHYHHGDTYVKGVQHLAPTAERKHMVGANHNSAERRRSILGVYYQYFTRRIDYDGPARTLTKEGYNFSVKQDI